MNPELLEFLSGVNSISADLQSVTNADSNGKLEQVQLVQVIKDGDVNHYLYCIGAKAIKAYAEFNKAETSFKTKKAFKEHQNKLKALLSSQSEDYVVMCNELGLSPAVSILGCFKNGQFLGKQSVHCSIQEQASADNAFAFLEMEHFYTNVKSLTKIGRTSLKGVDNKALENCEDDDEILALLLDTVMSNIKEAKVSNGIVLTFENRALKQANRINRYRASSEESATVETVGLDLSDI